jgi:hypothetical protein
MLSLAAFLSSRDLCFIYDAKSATVPEAEILLRPEEFGLVILSAWLSQEERVRARLTGL